MWCLSDVGNRGQPHVANCLWQVHGLIVSVNPAMLVFFAGYNASATLNSFCYWLFRLRKSDTVFTSLYNRSHVIEADRALLLLCHGSCFVMNCILSRGKKESLYNHTSYDCSGFLSSRRVLISAKSSSQSSRHIRCPIY